MKSILTAFGVTRKAVDTPGSSVRRPPICRPPYGRPSLALAAALTMFGAAPASADAPAVLRHDASVSERNALIVKVG